MTKSQIGVSVVVLVAIGVIARVLPHIPNFAPITASALFCGAYMPRRYSLGVTLAVLLVSDYLLLYINPFGATSFDTFYTPWDLWHSTLPFVYASFGISALAGWYVKAHRSAGVTVVAALFCSVQFFLITNAAVWLNGAYDRGITGLWESYVAGLPFFRGTVLGDLLYTSAFFCLYEMVRRESGAREEALEAA
jgi:hypothetical protein